MTDKPTPPRQGGNAPMSKEEMEGAFGRHPMADWRPTIRKGRSKTWMKRPAD